MIVRPKPNLIGVLTSQKCPLPPIQSRRRTCGSELAREEAGTSNIDVD
jgi:hypothetical protein